MTNFKSELYLFMEPSYLDHKVTYKQRIRASVAHYVNLKNTVELIQPLCLILSCITNYIDLCESAIEDEDYDENEYYELRRVLECYTEHALDIISYDIPELKAVGIDWKELARQIAVLDRDYKNEVAANLVADCTLILRVCCKPPKVKLCLINSTTQDNSKCPSYPESEEWACFYINQLDGLEKRGMNQEPRIVYNIHRAFQKKYLSKDGRDIFAIYCHAQDYCLRHDLVVSCEENKDEYVRRMNFIEDKRNCVVDNPMIVRTVTEKGRAFIESLRQSIMKTTPVDKVLPSRASLNKTTCWRTPDAPPSLIALAEAVQALGYKARCKAIQEHMTEHQDEEIKLKTRHPSRILADAINNGHRPYVDKWFTKKRGIIELHKEPKESAKIQRKFCVKNS